MNMANSTSVCVGDAAGLLTVESIEIEFAHPVTAALVSEYPNAVAHCLCSCGKSISQTVWAVDRIKSDVRKNDPQPAYPCGCPKEHAFWLDHQSPKFHPREYQTWWGIIRGCSDPRHPRWKSLGAKGYWVCAAWERDFRKFLSEMGQHPARHVLKIINNSKLYCRKNCQWVHESQQRVVSERLVTFHNTEKRLTEWAKEFSSINSLSVEANRQRILRGWDYERIISQTGGR